MSTHYDNLLREEPTLHAADGHYWHTEPDVNPFISADSASFIYIPTEWEHYFNILHHILNNQNVLLVIIGPHGIGKSIFMQQFLHQTDEIRHSYAVSADKVPTVSHLIATLMAEFGLPVNTEDGLEEQLDSQIAAIQYHEKPCILAIDNAESLTEEVLQALIYLIQQQSHAQMRLHILLFGETELQGKIAKLAKHELSSDMIHCVELEPLHRNETDQYIRHHFTAAGFKNVPFSEQLFERIYLQSRGIPKAINEFASKYLGEEIMESSETTVNFWQANQAKIIGATVLLVALLLTTMILDHNSKPSNHANKKANPSVVAFNNQATPQQPQQPIPDAKLVANGNANNGNYLPMANTLAPQPGQANPNQPQAITPVTTSIAAAAQDNHASSVTATNANSTATMQTAPAATTPTANSATPNTHAQAVPLPPAQEYVNPTSRNEEPQAIPADVNDNDAPKSVIAEQARLNEEKASAPATTVAAPTKSTAAVKEAITPVKHEVAKPVAATVADNETAATVKEKPVGKTTAKLNAKTMTEIPSEHHKPVATSKPLANAQGHRYTLQLMGVSNENNLKKFIAANKLDNAHIYHTTRQGKGIYILIYGDFASRAEAQQAIKKLPAAIQHLKPWARSYNSVHADMK